MKKLGSAHIVGQREIDEHASDLMRVVGVLFCRLAQVDLSHRPEFILTPTVGTNYRARVVVRVRDPYAAKMGEAQGSRTIEYEAEGNGPSGAAEELRDLLVKKLNERIESDVSALELCGKSFDWSRGYGKRHAQNPDGSINAEGEVVDEGTRVRTEAFKPLIDRDHFVKKRARLPEPFEKPPDDPERDR